MAKVNGWEEASPYAAAVAIGFLFACAQAGRRAPPGLIGNIVVSIGLPIAALNIFLMWGGFGWLTIAIVVVLGLVAGAVNGFYFRRNDQADISELNKGTAITTLLATLFACLFRFLPG